MKYAVYELVEKPSALGGFRKGLNQIGTVESADNASALTLAAEKTGRDRSEIRVAPYGKEL